MAKRTETPAKDVDLDWCWNPVTETWDVRPTGFHKLYVAPRVRALRAAA